MADDEVVSQLRLTAVDDTAQVMAQRYAVKLGNGHTVRAMLSGKWSSPKSASCPATMSRWK
jgi:hypothetical protein